MSNKRLTLLFDGHKLGSHGAQFSGAFDIDADDVDALELDRVGLAVVAFRVAGVSVSADRHADDGYKRVNKLKTEDFRILSGVNREGAIEFLSGSRSQLAFELQPVDEEDTVIEDVTPPVPVITAGPVDGVDPAEERPVEAGTIQVLRSVGEKKDARLRAFLDA
jgi:hypothetical protein